MKYVQFDKLSKDLQEFFSKTAISPGLDDQSFKEAFGLIQTMPLDDLILLKLADFAHQLKPSSENQLFRMCIDERLRDNNIVLDRQEPIFIYNFEHTISLLSGETKTVHVVDSDSTIRAREDFAIEPVYGQYFKNGMYINCEATRILLTDRVGFPPVVSSLKIEYDNKTKIISERSFRASQDQWEVFFSAAEQLVKELYDVDCICYRKHLIEGIKESLNKTLETKSSHSR